MARAEPIPPSEQPVMRTVRFGEALDILLDIYKEYICLPSKV